jgi:signal transduction histidine kinase
MSFTKAFTRQPRAWVVGEMVLCLVLIGGLDFATGYEIRLLPFYCAPIFVVAWFGGKRLGVWIGLVAGVISLAADWFAHDPDLSGVTQPWEIARHLGSCLMVALVAAALRSKSDSAAARISLLEHSQRLEREIVNISETEQRRIGQDLHDGLCQQLAALSCAATSLRCDLEDLRLRAEAATAGDLVNQLREAIVQTRDLAHELVPAHVSQVGLALALESLTQNVSRLHGVHCTFRSTGQLTNCDEHTATHLYRIAQEAINNATRHGKALHIAVSLEARGDRIALGIEDDGPGISRSSSGSTGMGLAVMRYRARLGGGELQINSPSGGGTVITCTARIQQPEKQASEVAVV